MKYLWLKTKLNEFTGLELHPFEPELITESEITKAENDLGIKFDSDLKEFWLDVGYGFFRRGKPLGNNGDIIAQVVGFSHPLEIASLISSDRDRFRVMIPFFDTADDTYLVVRPDGLIAFDYDPTVIVSNNVDRFVQKIFENPLFWVDIEDDEHRVATP